MRPLVFITFGAYNGHAALRQLPVRYWVGSCRFVLSTRLLSPAAFTCSAHLPLLLIYSRWAGVNRSQLHIVHTNSSSARLLLRDHKKQICWAVQQPAQQPALPQPSPFSWDAAARLSRSGKRSSLIRLRMETGMLSEPADNGCQFVHAMFHRAWVALALELHACHAATESIKHTYITRNHCGPCYCVFKQRLSEPEQKLIGNCVEHARSSRASKLHGIVCREPTRVMCSTHTLEAPVSTIFHHCFAQPSAKIRTFFCFCFCTRS